jgi:hypothetical protein
MYGLAITISILCVLGIIYLFYTNEEYKYIIHETPLVQPSIDDNSNCQTYFDFIAQPVNESYYTSPRFLNPRDSCRDECVEGVWFNDHHNGAVKCCEEACKRIKQ